MLCQYSPFGKGSRWIRRSWPGPRSHVNSSTRCLTSAWFRTLLQGLLWLAGINWRHTITKQFRMYCGWGWHPKVLHDEVFKALVSVTKICCFHERNCNEIHVWELSLHQTSHKFLTSLLFFKILLYSLKSVVNFVEAIREIYKSIPAAILFYVIMMAYALGRGKVVRRYNRNRGHGRTSTLLFFRRWLQFI